MNKKILITSFALILVAGLSTILTTNVHAQEPNIFPTMLQGLVSRFNLNQTEVDKYVEEQRDARQTERKVAMAERLNVAVSEEKITEAQKTLLLNKMAEHTETRGAEREEFQAWAKANGIDLISLNLGQQQGFGMARHFNRVR